MERDQSKRQIIANLSRIPQKTQTILSLLCGTTAVFDFPEVLLLTRSILYTHHTVPSKVCTVRNTNITVLCKLCSECRDTLSPPPFVHAVAGLARQYLLSIYPANFAQQML